MAKGRARRWPSTTLVDKVAFTGSTEVGKLIVKAATGNLKKVSLELGGKSPAIVFPDADLDRAIAGTASAIFFNHGQCCCAGSRLYAHERIFDEVVQGVSDIASKIASAPASIPSPRWDRWSARSSLAASPITSNRASTKARGVAVGGKQHGDRGYFVEPTVLTHTKPEMKVVREEIFGPVVCAEPFSDNDLDRIASEANDTIYGLAASVWTRDLSIAHKMARRIRSGTVWVNCHNVFDAGLPFGGYKQSGWGREMGEEVLHNYTEVKAVTIAL